MANANTNPAVRHGLNITDTTEINISYGGSEIGQELGSQPGCKFSHSSCCQLCFDPIPFTPCTLRDETSLSGQKERDNLGLILLHTTII